MNETTIETTITEEKPTPSRFQRLKAKYQRRAAIGLVGMVAMVSNAAAVNNSTFQGVIDIIDAIIPLFESLLDLIIAVFPLTIAMALLSALTLLITGIFYKVTKGTSK